MSENNLTTVRTLAAQLGISRNTVSLALRNHPSVAEATRERVKMAAAEAGYKINPAMASWMQYVRTHNKKVFQAAVGVIHPADRFFSGQPDPFYMTFFNGFCRQASDLGFSVDEFDLANGDLTTPRLEKILYARNIYTLAIIRAKSKKLDLDLDWEKYCVATVENPLKDKYFHSAANHHYHSATLAIAKAEELGYTRIGMAIANLASSKLRMHFASSFLVWQNTRPDLPLIPLPTAPNLSPKEFIEWVRAFQPELIISPHPEHLLWLRNAGIKVPQQIGFINLSWRAESPEYAGVDQNAEEIGRAAMDLLAGQFWLNARGEPAIPRMVLIEGKWQPGSTVSPVKPKRRKKTSRS